MYILSLQCPTVRGSVDTPVGEFLKLSSEQLFGRCVDPQFELLTESLTFSIVVVRSVAVTNQKDVHNLSFEVNPEIVFMLSFQRLMSSPRSANQQNDARRKIVL